MASKKFEAWLRRQILTVREDIGPCVRLSLKHVKSNGRKSKNDEVGSVTIGETDDIDLSISAWANEVEGLAQEHCEGVGEGKQKYACQAFFAEDAHSSKGEYAFVMFGPEDDDNDEDHTSEPATKTGMLAQLMRHNEAMMRSHVMGQNQLMQTMVQSSRRLHDQVETLMSERFEFFKLLEETNSRKHERDLEMEQLKANQERNSEIISSVRLLLPAIGNRLMGSKIFETEDFRVKTLKNFFESINDEQMERIEKVLNREQRAFLLNLIVALDKGDKIDFLAMRTWFQSLGDDRVIGIMGQLTTEQRIAIQEILKDLQGGEEANTVDDAANGKSNHASG